MKKVISMLLLIPLILVSFAGCGTPNKKTEADLREEIKKELETEKAANKEKDISKTPKADMKDMDSIYEFIKQDIKGLSREDFNLWEANYMDITGDGSDEVVLAGVSGVEQPDKMQIISGDSGKYKRIPSDIPLYKYENKPELKDGFFVVTGRTGGTGTESTYMNLYIYNGWEIINALRDIEIHYRVSEKNIDEEKVGKIDGKLTDFTLTLIKYDYLTSKETMETKERYVYNADTMSFNIESTGGQGAKTVDASDLKAGHIIDGRTIDKLIYTEGDEFGIGLNGEFTVAGLISYDEIFWDGIILSIDQEPVLSEATVIKFKFDGEYECIPPAGTFIIDDNNLKLLESKIGSNLLTEIKNGKNLKVNAVIDNYAYYAKYQTSPMWSCDMIDVISFGTDNEGQEPTGQFPEDGAKTLYLSELKDGDYIDGKLIIKDINYKKGDETANFKLVGTTVLKGEFYFDNMWNCLAFDATDDKYFPATIVIEGPNDTFQYKPRNLAFRNEEYVSSAFSEDKLTMIKNGGSMDAEILVKDISFSMKFGSEGGSICELIQINSE